MPTGPVIDVSANALASTQKRDGATARRARNAYLADLGYQPISHAKLDVSPAGK
jgi:hypothetical protein